MQLNFHGQTVLISGGTSGIGLAAAAQFLAAGAQVMLMGRSAARGEAALAALRGKDCRVCSAIAGNVAGPSGGPSAASARPAGDSGAAVKFVAGDVSHREDCAAAVEATLAAYGHLDILVNSAGIYQEGALEDLTEAELDSILATNVKGTFWLTQAALAALKQSHGAIVNVASDAGVHGNYFCTAYSASKGAVVMFTRSLALELAAAGVRVNAIAPGDILTPLTEKQLHSGSVSREDMLREMSSVYPLGRIGTPDEAAAVILFLASSQASFVTGAVWSVDGGLTS